jgi:serine/threonine-protein kinase SRPK3
MLTGRYLFSPTAGETCSLEDDHLAKMLELTGERLSPAMLERAQFKTRYLGEHGTPCVHCHLCPAYRSSGDLLRVQLIPGQSIEAALAAYNTVPKPQIAGAASFIRACLRLDSSDRASAAELQVHPWIIWDCDHNH